jgi:hypothetical protein
MQWFRVRNAVRRSWPQFAIAAGLFFAFINHTITWSIMAMDAKQVAQAVLLGIMVHGDRGP